MPRKTVYLDYHATTPCDPKVVEAMLPFFSENFANSSSSIHRPGKLAADAVDNARATIAEAIGAQPRELIFTSGATESNNLAISGFASRAASSKRHIVTCAIEHKSVLEPCKQLANNGFRVTFLPVQTDGRIDLGRLAEAITPDTLLVSIQAANNEVGTIQPIAAISEIVHARGALLHSDAVQALGRLPIDVAAWGADAMSFSAHKLYGPKGIGGLYLRGGVRAQSISPLFYGGGQEFGLRPGTLNVPAIVGFAKAVELATTTWMKDVERIKILRNNVENAILAALPNTKRNGSSLDRLAGNSNLTFPGIDTEALLANVPELALSTGSACTSGTPEPSHVLLALGLSRLEAFNTMRICIGKDTTSADADFATAQIIAAVRRITELAPGSRRSHLGAPSS